MAKISGPKSEEEKTYEQRNKKAKILSVKIGKTKRNKVLTSQDRLIFQKLVKNVGPGLRLPQTCLRLTHYAVRRTYSVTLKKHI
jgi:hypothetical protein